MHVQARSITGFCRSSLELWCRVARATPWCAGILAGAARAGSIWSVNSTGDPASGTPANCSAGNPNTWMLRDALAAAASGDTIAFDVGSDQTITLTLHHRHCCLESIGKPWAASTRLLP